MKTQPLVTWSNEAYARSAAEDPFDDGGTPMWRRNHAPFRTINAVPKSKFGWFRWYMAFLALSLMPVFVLFWGLTALLVWNCLSDLIR